MRLSKPSDTMGLTRNILRVDFRVTQSRLMDARWQRRHHNMRLSTDKTIGTSRKGRTIAWHLADTDPRLVTSFPAKRLSDAYRRCERSAQVTELRLRRASGVSLVAQQIDACVLFFTQLTYVCI